MTARRVLTRTTRPLVPNSEYIGHDHGYTTTGRLQAVGRQIAEHLEQMKKPVEGQRLIDRMTALVWYDQLDRDAVVAVINRKDWDAARALIKSVNATAPLEND